MAARDRSVWSILSVWFICLFEFNQTHETDRADPTDQIDKTDETDQIDQTTAFLCGLDYFPEVFDRAKKGILELYLRLPF
jgi:hypothetical protein